MKTILAPVELHHSIDAVLTTALQFARRFDSCVEGLPIGPDLPDLVAFDMPVSWTAADQSTWRELAEESRRRFEDAARLAGAPAHDAAQEGQGFSWSWSGEAAYGDSHISNYGRLFDLCVLGRPGGASGGPRMASVEAALFDSGRPVLLAPPRVGDTIGDTVVIAWNRSMESARVVAMAMAVLQRARRVYVLTIPEWRVEGPEGEHLAQNLCANGVPAQAVERHAKGRSPGEAILEHATELGADLLLKGAYTQSRLRQMIFGGATAHVLARAQMPVLMAN